MPSAPDAMRPEKYQAAATNSASTTTSTPATHLHQWWRPWAFPGTGGWCGASGGLVVGIVVMPLTSSMAQHRPRRRT